MFGERRGTLGAIVRGDTTLFRVWAPQHREVRVVLETGRAKGEHPLKLDTNGYHVGAIGGVVAGDRYRYRLGERLFPDPASRCQPDGPHGPSQVVDPGTFRWTDAHWKGVSLPGQVLYEMHIGTFTREGTWAAAARELPALAELGVTVLEIMPVADFAGRFGWGYDGVFLFAPTRLYGRAGRLPPLRRCRARSRARRHPRRGVQPLRSGRDRRPRVLAALFQRPPHERLGQADQLRRCERGARPRLLPRERRVLDSRIPSRRRSASTRPRRSRTTRRSTS